MHPRSNRSKRHQSLYSLLVTCVQGISLGYSLIYHAVAADIYWDSVHIGMAMLSTCFYLLWFVARIQLGVSLTFFARTDGLLVKHGLYRRFRNPIYLFGSCTIACYILLLNSYRWLLLLCVLIPIQLLRASNEATALKRKHGDEYTDYVKSLWF
jgi:protein-S-isoprenylcysteine O-methyltransferase Ste14